ncbi:MAG: VOC family protein [Longimicrobiales bacterium]
MVKTFGLTHVALVVRDAERSLAFYESVLGMVVVFREPGFIQAQTPGSRDALVFEEGPPRSGDGGIAHFGFRLTDPGDINAAMEAIERAGGEILRQGEFVPGAPFVFFRDPDGNEVEIWFEPPTAVDPQ